MPGERDVCDGVLEDYLVVIPAPDVDGVSVKAYDLSHELLTTNKKDRDKSPILTDEVENLVLNVDFPVSRRFSRTGFRRIFLHHFSKPPLLY